MKNILAVLVLVAIATLGLTSFAATESASTSTPYGFGEDKVQKVTWSAMNGGDVGVGIKSANWTVKSITVSGTFLGASATVQGSNDGVAYYNLTEVGGTSISLASAGIKAIRENPLYIRPMVTGSVSASLVFDLIMAK